MTTITTNNYSLSRASEFLIRIGKVFSAFAAAHKLNKQIRETELELSKLSTRELNDIGISRGDIHMIARGDTSHCRAAVNTNLNGWV